MLCSAYEDMYSKVKSFDALCWSGILSPFQSVKNQIISKPKFKVVNRYLPFTKKRQASIVADKEVWFEKTQG